MFDNPSARELAGKAGAGLAVIAVVALLWWIYDLGKLNGATELESARVQNAMLTARNDKLTADMEALREQLAILERSSQIDAQAAKDVRGSFEGLEEELQAAREQVEFYRGIVSPGDVKPGLRIHRFSLEAGVQPGEYHYELVLTQLKRNDRVVKGLVEWQVEGMQNGEPAILALSDITEPQVRQLKFRFRYFQDLAGTLKVPGNFTGKRVHLTVKPSGKGKQEPVVKAFDWPLTSVQQ